MSLSRIFGQDKSGITALLFLHLGHELTAIYKSQAPYRLLSRNIVLEPD